MTLMTTLSRSLLLAALACVATGCFDPSLGDLPFVCARTGKECPDDYVCDRARSVCVPSGAADSGVDVRVVDVRPSKEGPLFLDGRPVQPPGNCLDAGNEPNNRPDDAQQILNDGRLPDWEICYPLDIDYFAFDVKAGQKIEVRVLFKHSEGDLDAALIDPDGAVVSQGRTESDNENLDVSTAAKAGRYFVAVYGFAGQVNKYDIQLSRQ